MLDSQLYHKAADMVEKGWTQKTGARNWRGYAVYSSSKEAASWCLEGALRLAVYKTVVVEDSEPTLDRLIRNLGLKESIFKWNDHPDRTKEQVTTLLRDTAARGLL